MNIIILQHIKIEDPGYIKDLMLADGLNLTTIELDEGEKIPNDLSKFDLKKIDYRGSFESDDETGVIFDEIKNIVKQLDNFKGEEQ